MSEEQYPHARLESVSAEGELIFATSDTTVRVTVDDRLERAILEAKQIIAEHQPQPTPQTQKTLPISQIQSLIRAGADPDKVAERYNLSPALVRRFSATVESEKSYAIEQFLRVPAPKESKVRSLADLIERTLAAARVRPEAVQWSATRRGLEPWRIAASFESAGHPIRAEWSWSMQDNSVICINNAARKLIGEISTSQQTRNDQDDALEQVLPAHVELPGDSARSARIEMTVSTFNHEEHNEAESDSSNQSGNAAPSTTSSSQSDSPQEQNMQRHDQQQENTPSENTTSQEQASPAPEPESHSAPSHPHARRPQVPSWDEIMFGSAPKQ